MPAQQDTGGGRATHEHTPRLVSESQRRDSLMDCHGAAGELNPREKVLT